MEYVKGRGIRGRKVCKPEIRNRVPANKHIDNHKSETAPIIAQSPMAILTKQDENTQPPNVETVSKNLSNLIKPKILIKTRDNKQDTIAVAKQNNANDKKANHQGDQARKLEISANMKMPPKLKTSLQIIDEGGQWTGDACIEYTTDQSNYCVVGVIGGQGVGKSTIASLLTSRDSSEIFKDGPFTISPREIREAALYQTDGIDMFITPERMIILDTYPLLSIAHLTESPPFRDSKYERGFMENQSELHALQLLLFLINICHSIVVVSDCGIDLNLCRLLLTAEMLRSDLTENVNPELPYLVFLNNRISVQELNRHVFRRNVEMLNEVFSSSQYKITGIDAYRAELPHLRVKRPANLFLLPEIDADKQAAFSADRGFIDGKIPPIECFVRSLTRQILGLRRSYPLKSGQSEKTWLQSASRAWNASRKSNLLAEFTQFVP